jgi:hypothetical protein
MAALQDPGIVVGIFAARSLKNANLPLHFRAFSYYLKHSCKAASHAPEWLIPLLFFTLY